ncbi:MULTISPECIES: 50S ribosomal protein L35 [unclassified Spiroplasma]|uniref:50S ribosomal protein L35 n=1 Tax=unclassified Spiroplasma TaxID=2637901 RepID=UPI001C043976|nr:50S ribosomal protein L35 [Spiroplasma endosymbiont of 'Nebria riversi']
MPKMKTKKALQKRIKITGTGKWKRKHAFTSHLAQNKSTKQKRHLSKEGTVDKTDYRRLKNLLLS